MKISAVCAIVCLILLFATLDNAPLSTLFAAGLFLSVIFLILAIFTTAVKKIFGRAAKRLDPLNNLKMADDTVVKRNRSFKTQNSGSFTETEFFREINASGVDFEGNLFEQAFSGFSDAGDYTKLNRDLPVNCKFCNCVVAFNQGVCANCGGPLDYHKERASFSGSLFSNNGIGAFVNSILNDMPELDRVMQNGNVNINIKKTYKHKGPQ